MRKFLRALFVKNSAPSPEKRALSAITAAANELESVWGVCIAYEAAGHFTCNEAEALADLFRAVGLDDVAEQLIEGHAHADDDEDDLHHDMYRDLNAYRLSA